MFSPARYSDLGVAAVVVPRRSPALPLVALGLRSSRVRPLRRVLSALVATTVATAGLASSSCASPALPARAAALRNTATGYRLEVLVDGAAVRTYQHRGETYVMGELGARYTLRVHNDTGQRIEAVASIDGRDAMDGKGADFKKRGYVVAPWSSVDIEGWRLTRAEAAAFRFSSVADSYAARTGNAREVGVIGVAIFPERQVEPPRPLDVPPQSYQAPRHRSEWSSDAERDGRDGFGSAPPALGRRDDRLEGVAPRKVAPSGSAEAQASGPALSSRDGVADRPASRAPEKRAGLGTEFGEAVASPVRDVAFTRAHFIRPNAVLGVRYNDRDGLVALGIEVDACCAGDDADLALRQSATPFPAGGRRYASPPPGWHRGCCVRY